MTVHNNAFTTRLQNINRPSAVEKPAASGTSFSAASTSASTQNPSSATQVPASPVGLVGNHVNTTA